MSASEIRVVEGGKCVKVHVKVGDMVEKDQVIAATEADKDTREYKAPAAGKITEVGVEEGKFVKLGQLVAAIAEVKPMKETEIRVVEGGKCTKIAVNVGDQVEEGQVIVATEADKDTREYKAPVSGVITAIGCEVGKFVRLGQVLAVIASESGAEEAAPEPAAAEPVKESEELRVIEGGKCTKIAVKVGDRVKKDQVLVATEADKDTREYKSPIDGVVTEIGVEEGKFVRLGQLIVKIEKAEEKEPVRHELRVIEGGKAVKVVAEPGMEVHKGDVLVATEADKDTREYKAPADGVVTSVGVKAGEFVKLGQLLVALEEKEIAAADEGKHAQLLIIGGGPGGYVAAIYAAKKGLKVTLVEKENLGGTCLNVGCIPTKALIRSAEVNHLVQEAGIFGIDVQGAVKPDMNRIIARKDDVVRRLVGGVESLMKSNQVTVIRGTASFVSDTEVMIHDKDGSEYTMGFDDVIIATGSRISRINFPGIDLPFVLNSTTALANRSLPEKITIIGGGVIGLEFAFLYRDLGAEVTVVEFLDRLIAMVDTDISEYVRRMGEEKGIRFELSARVTELKNSDAGKAVTVFEKGGETKEIESDAVLVAIGREPNMEGLDIDKAAVELNDRGRGIKVDMCMRTNKPHIYAIGDVNNIIQLAHAASHQGMIAVDAILGDEHPFRREEVPSVIFTSPEVATVGLGEDDLRKQGRSFKTGRFDYVGNGKALTMNETKGFIKLMKDENDVIVGGAIVGADASSLIETVNAAVVNHLKDTDLQKMIFAHPTTGEVIHEAAMDLGIGHLHL